MGRVFALRDVLVWLVHLVSVPIMGALADAIPVQWVYALAGGLYWLGASFGLLAPRLRRARLAEDELGAASYGPPNGN